jgi:predicted nucleotidyltransferase
LQNKPTPPATLTVPIGTQIVLHQISPGSVAEIIAHPADTQPTYQTRLVDGRDITLNRNQFSILKRVKAGPLLNPQTSNDDLDRYVIYRCVVGSQAYDLDREDSDIDRRGIYLPPADLEWSIYGVPEQLERPATEECYWELKKFLLLALKANPNILECLFTPIIEQTSEIAETLLAHRHIFLSKLVYQTYNGYVLSQFKKLEQDLRTTGVIKWKHAMHLIRLLLQGISVLAEAHVPVRISEHRASLLTIRDGSLPWEEVNTWRLALHQEFDTAFRSTSLPEAPNYAEANRLLIWARRKMVEVEHGS